jgi:hypothetical protein
MKIAICISGQLRKLEESLITTAFKDYDVDYYIHTWAHHLNPNLKNVYKHFPNAKIEIETYDKFDSLFVDSEFDTDVNRYRYAQFYTISKSFNLCKNSNKQYNCYIRTRTDVVWPMHLWKKTEEQLSLDLYSVLINSRHIPNKADIVFTTSEIPTIATAITGINNELLSLREWSWGMNKSAFDVLSNIPTDSLVKLAENIKDINSTTLVDNRIQSPGIWGEIFKRNGICIQDSSQFRTTLLRYYNDKRKYIGYYGDIS